MATDRLLNPADEPSPRPSVLQESGMPDLPSRSADVALKQLRVAEFLEDEGYDALWLQGQDNFAWFTGGGDNSAGAPGPGKAALLITADARSIVADNVEAARIFEEEVGGLGFQLKQSSWHEPGSRLRGDLCRGRKVASDVPAEGTVYEFEKVRRLRLVLTELERTRYTDLGHDISHALEATCRAVTPGETEADVAGQLGHRLLKRSVSPVQLYVAADDRAAQFRHPVFKDNPIRKRCLVSVFGRRHGLCAGATRIVSFDKPPAALVEQFNLAAMLDATYIYFSNPNELLAEVFRRALRIYEKFGSPHEWILCDQGGVVGYSPHEVLVRPESPFRLRENMALSWNPTIGAARSQDTVIIDDQGFEVVTSVLRWPTTTVCIKGQSIDRPAILVR